MDSIDRAFALQHFAIDRNAVSRPDTEFVAEAHMVERHVLIRRAVFEGDVLSWASD